MAKLDRDDLDFRKFRKELAAGSDLGSENYFVDVYEKVCDLYPGYTEAPFPIGMEPLSVESHPLILEMSGWGRKEGPTIVGLIQKIVTAHEEKIDELWNARKEAQAKARKAVATGGSEGTLQNQG